MPASPLPRSLTLKGALFQQLKSDLINKIHLTEENLRANYINKHNLIFYADRVYDTMML